jgi:hypothetical protein
VCDYYFSAMRKYCAIFCCAMLISQVVVMVSCYGICRAGVSFCHDVPTNEQTMARQV